VDVKKSIVQDSIKYSSGRIIAQGIGMVRGLAVAAILGPTALGLWNALSLIFSYGKESHLGTLNALDREVPINRGKEDWKRVAAVQDVTLGAILSLPLLVAVVIFAISFFLDSTPEVVFGLRLLAPAIIFGLLYDFFFKLFRAYHNFGMVARLVVIMAAIDIILALALSAVYGIYGLFVAQLATYFLMFIIARRYSDFKVHIRFSIPASINLVKIGLPILMVGLVNTLLSTADRLMIIKFLGQTDLGYYAIGLGMVQVLLLVPYVIAEVLYPRIAYAYGQSQQKDSLQAFVIQPQLLISIAAPLLAGALFIIFPALVTLLLPDYIPGITAGRILIAGWVFMALPGAGAALYTIGKQRIVLWLTFAAVILNVIFNYIAISLDTGISGVAVATSASYGLRLVAGIGIGLYILGMAGRRVASYLVRIFLPIVYVFFLLMAISYLGGLWGLDEGNVYARTAIEALLFATGSLPLLIVLWRRMKEFGVMDIIRNWRKRE